MPKTHGSQNARSCQNSNACPPSTVLMGIPHRAQQSQLPPTEGFAACWERSAPPPSDDLPRGTATCWGCPARLQHSIRPAKLSGDDGPPNDAVDGACAFGPQPESILFRRFEAGGCHPSTGRRKQLKVRCFPSGPLYCPVQNEPPHTNDVAGGWAAIYATSQVCTSCYSASHDCKPLSKVFFHLCYHFCFCEKKSW